MRENDKIFSLYHVFSIRSGSKLCDMRLFRCTNVSVRIFEYTIYIVLCVNQRLSVKLHWLEFPSHVPHICCYGQHLVGGYFDREYTSPQNSKNEDHGRLSQTKYIIRSKMGINNTLCIQYLPQIRTCLLVFVRITTSDSNHIEPFARLPQQSSVFCRSPTQSKNKLQHYITTTTTDSCIH